MERDYEIGGHRFRVVGARLVSALDGVDGFRPFLVAGESAETEFVFRESDGTEVPSFCKKVYSFRYEDIDSSFGITAGGYLLEQHPRGEEALRLWTGRRADEAFLCGNFSPRLLRFALWTGYGVMTVRQDTVAMHGSCIVHRGKAVLFLGESGTGKSTHTRLWREHIADSLLLNDDSPVVRREEGGLWVYGSPWSGKTPCYKTERYPLAGCVRLSQAPFNRMQRLDTLQAYAALHPSMPPAFAYDGRLYDGICGTLGRLLSQIPVYHLSCLPDRAAAELACHTFYP